MYRKIIIACMFLGMTNPLFAYTKGSGYKVIKEELTCSPGTICGMVDLSKEEAEKLASVKKTARRTTHTHVGKNRNF